MFSQWLPSHLSAVAALIVGAQGLAAQSATCLSAALKPIAFVHARIVPVTSPPIDDATLVIRDGRIVAVGRGIVPPAGAVTIDARGTTIMPGIVESHSHAGLKRLYHPESVSDNSELSKPVNAEVRVIDGINSSDVAFALAAASGVTTMNVMPGSRSPASGQAAVLKLRGGTAEEMYLAPGGLKFAIRTGERRPGFPTTIDEAGAILRSELLAAQDYAARLAKYDSSGRTGPRPARNLAYEALGMALRRELVVHIHVISPAEMRIAFALADEFHLDVALHHALGVDSLAPELKRRNIPISFGVILPSKGPHDRILDGPVWLAKLGGEVSFHSDQPDGPVQFLRHDAAGFIDRGMPEVDALRALTINPARMLRLDRRIGSIDVGKDADLLFLDGPPLDWESRVVRVFVEGKEVFNQRTGCNAFATHSPGTQTPDRGPQR